MEEWEIPLRFASYEGQEGGLGLTKMNIERPISNVEWEKMKEVVIQGLPSDF